MKIITKNNCNFAAGMFWQIPEEGSRKINFAKLVKDTKHNMFCQIRRIKPTWGFCHKDELQGEKNVASLGKFIIETSGLSAIYANSIICYKFKDAGEVDDGRELKQALYGYIVLLNGTICPHEGEYVAEFAAVKESILMQCKHHEIETLYLPSDVASKFFSVYELFADACNNPQLLQHLFFNLSVNERAELSTLIAEQETLNGKNYMLAQVAYRTLFANLDVSEATLRLLQQLIKEPFFEQQVNATREKNIKYLVPNVYVLAFTSDEIYWHNPKFARNFKKSQIQSVFSQTSRKYKLLLGLLVIGLSGYVSYGYLTNSNLPLSQSMVVAKPMPIVPKELVPDALITACVANNDRFFGDLGAWTFMQMKCNSLGAILTFNADTEVTLADFARLVGTGNTINVTGKVGLYKERLHFPVMADQAVGVAVAMGKSRASSGISTAVTTVRTESAVIARDQVTNNLQQAAINYKFKLTLAEVSSKGAVKRVKFTLRSQLSPIFLLNHGVLAHVKLIAINMNFDKSSGFYTWILDGIY